MAAAFRLLVTLQPLLLQVGQAVGLQMDTISKLQHRDNAAAGRLVRRDVAPDEIEEHHGEHTASKDYMAKRLVPKGKRLAVPNHVALAVISDGGLIEHAAGSQPDQALGPAPTPGISSVGDDSGCDCTYNFAKAYNITRCIKEAEHGVSGVRSEAEGGEDKCSKSHDTTGSALSGGSYDNTTGQLTSSNASIGTIDIGSLMASLAGEQKSTAVKDAFTKLMDHCADQNLAPALAANNVVWTDTDANTFEACQDRRSCYASDGSNILEDQSSVNGCHVDQGDNMPAHCVSSSLMQVYDDKGNLTQFGTLLEAAATHRRVVDNIWPQQAGTNNHVIKYCFASGTSAAAKEAIGFAKLHLEEQVACIRLEEVASVPGANSFADAEQENCNAPGEGSILIQSSKAGCWSLVGMHSHTGSFSGMSQPLNIGTGCEEMGIAAHEIGHAIGMLHEMSRDDRNSYLSVAMEHVPTNFQINFQTNGDADQGTTFDFLSLMMYGAYAFSNSGELTITPNHIELVNFMGQRMGFSELDVELIGRLYSCADRVTPQTLNRRLSEAYVTGDIDTGFVGLCEDKTGSSTGFTNPTTQNPMTCTELREHCNHQTLGSTVRAACPVSCYVCSPGDGYVGGAAPPSSSTQANTSTKTTERTVTTNCTDPRNSGLRECAGACAWKLGFVYALTLFLLLGQA